MSSMFRNLKLLALTAIVAAVATMAHAQSPAYVAGTWSDNAVHFLDINLNNLSSFPAGSSNPNGIATDGTLIYTGHFTSNEVIAYNYAGVEQFRWSAAIGGLQGMELVRGDIAVYNASNQRVEYYNPANGAPLFDIPGAPGTIEGLAFDGSVLWQLNESVIYATDPATGAIFGTIPNPAFGAQFDGTGLTSSGPNELTVAANNGDWWKISSISGAIQSSGNNGLDMYALKSTGAIPEPGSLALVGMGACSFAAVALRRRLG